MSIQKVRAGYRVSTGPVQFDDDWPGYFIRGDEAILGLANDMTHMAQSLRSMATYLETRAAEFKTAALEPKP